MTISKRKLMQYRKEALKTYQDCPQGSKRKAQAGVILILTQELIDQHLITETQTKE
jgi:hypothetical protein